VRAPDDWIVVISRCWRSRSRRSPTVGVRGDRLQQNRRPSAFAVIRFSKIADRRRSRVIGFRKIADGQ
jgi:hypothetical protein